jgi:hypothetical protein
MTATAETPAATKAAELPRYELRQTFKYKDGYTKSHQTTFYGSAAKARKERIDRLKAARREYRVDGETVAYDTPGDHGYETLLEWVQL